eukprot:CAMPEP_0175038940 /NCGR_PEP_ID=MMETSP0052_2-20121109/209_1 /TAXON_ID=51329 ORGANISM="Polytomella parva, Strain SAG 63-3" /NCGR_SAMPLE_ID=MMETSP0052_2 /ASSEMBLY_ACC=CAM_ASM_000194 /LENGTH=67 /DNA_ID=CAMNT_0016300541 /DNA_START=642 /DNA_END=845 /DNA_ORIENTATION=+
MDDGSQFTGVGFRFRGSDGEDFEVGSTDEVSAGLSLKIIRCCSGPIRLDLDSKAEGGRGPRGGGAGK